MNLTPTLKERVHWARWSACFYGAMTGILLLGSAVIRADSVPDTQTVGRIVTQIDAGQFTAAAAQINQALLSPGMAADARTARRVTQTRGCE